MVDYRRHVDILFTVLNPQNSQKQEVRGSEDFSKGMYSDVHD